MKNLKAITIISISASSFALSASAAPPTGGAYKADEQRFFIEGQPVTETIEIANNIVCNIANMRPDAFVSDGPYLAKLFEERCATTGADATAEQASASATSSQSSTTAKSTKGASEQDTETAFIATVQAIPVAENPSNPYAAQPMIIKGWVDNKAQDEQGIDNRIYLTGQIDSGKTDDAPNGEFEMRWSFHSLGLPSWFTQYSDEGDEGDEGDEAESMPTSINLGVGYLKVSGQELKFKDYNFEGEGNVALRYLPDGSISGVYGQPVSFCLDCDTIDFQFENPTFRSFTAFNQFYIDKPSKQICTTLGEAFENCYSPDQNEFCAAAFAERDALNADNPDYNEYAMIELPVTLAELADLAESDPYAPITFDEVCYSTKASDAQKNVFRYGVYTGEGDRASSTTPGTRSAFPMFSEVEIEVDDPDNPGEKVTFDERIFAYADYWGVYVDPRGQRLIEPGVTQFQAEVFGEQQESEVEEFFTLQETEVRVEKRTKSFQSLNELDRLKLALYVQDAYWSAEYKSLLGVDPFAEGGFAEYEGYFDATAQKFILNKGVTFFPNYQASELETPIEFTPTDWLNKMKKVEDYGTDENGESLIFTDQRNLGVWSNDTRQWYEISAAALKDPTLSSPDGEPSEFYDPFDRSRGGITTESTENISPSDLSQDLVCMQDCLTPLKVQETFGYAYCANLLNSGKSDLENCSSFTASESGSAPAPFAPGGPYLAETTSVIRIYEDEEAKNMLQSFFLAQSENTLGRDGFRLASPRAQIIDYLYIAEDVDSGITESGTYARTARLESSFQDDQRLYLDLYADLNLDNLNQLLAGSGGKAPIMTFDLASAPQAGTTGTTDVEVKVIKQDEGDPSNAKSLAATIPVKWAGTDAGFTLTVPAGADYQIEYVSDGVGVTATLTNANDQVFGYSGGNLSNRGRPGLTLKLLSLFGGKLGNVDGLALPSFFESGGRYQLSLEFNNGFSFQAGDSSPLNALNINFGTASAKRFEQYDIERFEAGQWWDGIRDSSLIRYKPTAAGFDVASVPLSKGEVINNYLRTSTDPYSAFGNATYSRPDGWSENLSYGLRTGQLVAEADLAKLECKKVNGKYEDHPAFTGSEETEMRYCTNKIHEAIGLTTYSISLDVQPSYALIDASGEPVTIAAPRTMYYEVPEGDAFGSDGGKRLSLEFAGHGELRGVPGFVYDTATGEDKGEFVSEWKDTYRYLSRFTIPDGAVITDLDGVEYFVKALDGEQWLKALDDATASGKYDMGLEDLVPDNELRVFGESQMQEFYIGEPPTCPDPSDASTCNLLNKGVPAVVHGELVVGADPTPAVQ